MNTSLNNPFDSVLSTPMNRRSALRIIAGAGTAVFAATALGRAALVGAAQHAPVPHAATANLNLRSEPSTRAKVLLVIPKGGAVALRGQQSNGFWLVSYQGTEGWAFADYLHPTGARGHDPVITGEARTTANGNFRSGPGTSYTAIHVVPAGTWVNTTDVMSNDYRQLVYSGRAGWISRHYLSTSGGGTPKETFRTTARLNLRKDPSLNARVLLVIPSGATVEARSGKSGRFRQVAYKGTVGWAHLDYLN